MIKFNQKGFIVLKRYFLLLITIIIYANPSTIQTVPLDEPFEIESKKSAFDINILYTHKKLLKCNPKLNAVYRIIDAHKIKIIPKESLQSSTIYSCRYKRDIIKFKSVKFNIIDAHFFKRGELIRVEFNDKIELNNVKKYISIIKRDRLSKTKLSYSISQNNNTTLVLKIDEPISNHPIELLIDKNLTNINGKSLNSDFSKIFNIKNSFNVKLDDKKEAMEIIDSPRFVSSDSGELAIRLYFDDTIDNKIENFIEIDGIDNFRVDSNNYVGYRERKRFKLSDNAYYYTDIISSEFKPNHTYHLTLKKGLKNYRELKHDIRYTLKSGDLEKNIIFDKDKIYISNMGEFGFSSVNLNSVTLVVERVLDDNLRYFVNFTDANRYDVDKYLEEVFTKEIKLHNIKNKIVKQKFKLSNLSNQLPYGIYKITMRYKSHKEEIAKSKILFISNIGISANLSKNQAFIFVNRLDSAKPLVSAMVYLYSANNELISSAKTDKYGVVDMEINGLLYKSPKSIIVETKNDRNFLALNKTISSPSPENILEKAKRFSANIYLQSKIVRPASKINALITVKDREFISAKKIPIKILFKRKYGKVLSSKIYHTDDYGLIDYSYQLDSIDRTGDYKIIAYIDKKEIGSISLKVEAFRPPKIENYIRVTKDNYLNGELIELNISSNYLFGTPSSGLSGKVTLNATPIDFVLTQYSGYSFTNENLEEEDTINYIDYSEDIRLDSNGELNMVIPINIKKRTPSILKGIIGVTIMDGNQPVSAYKTVKIFPYKDMVGVRLDNSHLKIGDRLDGSVIVIDPLTGEPISNRDLYITIKKIDWHYSYINGNSNWEKESRIVDSFNIKSNSSFSRVINQSGDYTIEVDDPLSGHSSSSSFDIWWDDYNNISPKDNLKSVEIKFEDKLYKNGDVIFTKIKSPILNGELLLSLEDDRVEGYKLIHIEKGVAEVEMPILFDIKKGAYLHATVYRPSNTSSKLIPFRAIGYRYIKPDNSSHKIAVKIQAPKETKSKRVVKLNIVTNKKAKILVSVVDRGILQLVNQKKPKIFDFFNKQLDKEIAYYDLYDQLMAYLVEGKLIDFGAGDMLLKNRKKHLAPDLAKRVKPFMIWSGIIEANSNTTTIGIKIPEFNGRASIVAIAINEDSIGVASKDMVIKDDIMIKPSYPLYFLKGDNIKVPIRVFNTTKQDKNITLNYITTKNIEFNIKDKNITIPSNSSTLIEATLKAKEEGKAKITIKAYKVSNSIELPIYNPYAISTKTFKGITNKKMTFTIPKEYIGAEAYIYLSDNLIGVLANDLKYLIRYPYGCAEQISSKILAMHYARAFLHNNALISDSKNFIRQGVKRLRDMQNSYGEFNYWQGENNVNPYASLYASETLLDLHRDGVWVDRDTLDKVIKALKSIVLKNDNYLGTYTSFHRVYAGYILAKNGKLNEGIANMLYEKGLYENYFISKYYMSAILKMQGREKEAQKLYNSVGYSLSSHLKSRYSKYSGNFESNIRDMFIHFIIKTKYFKKEINDLAIIKKSFDELYSTQEKALALKAISIYLGKPKSAKINVTLNINGKDRNYTKPTVVDIDNIKSNKIILIPNSSALAYTIELVKHLPKKIKNSIKRNERLGIKREFINENNRTINLKNIHLGDKIYSKVTISNYGKINSVVINHRVPACLTIINDKEPNRKFRDININREYRDIRDDRVLDFIDLPKKQIYNRKSKRYIVKSNQGVIFTSLLATTKGECKLPAIIAESMYDNRVNNYAKEANSIIVKDKKVKKEESLEKRAKALVKKLYYREMQSSNPADFIELFSYPIDSYFNKKSFTRADLLKDKAKYLHDWKVREYSNIKLKTISLDKKSKEIKIKITFNYRLKNGKKKLKGVSKHLLTIKKIDGDVLITKIEVI